MPQGAGGVLGLAVEVSPPARTAQSRRRQLLCKFPVTLSITHNFYPCDGTQPDVGEA
jgi:hypothetical protein